MIRPLTFAIVALISSGFVRAGLIVDVQNATISAGGNGFLDVLIRSTGSETVDSVDYEFRITPNVAAGSLSFVDPQDETENAELDYIFVGDSAGIFAAVSTTTTMNDTVVGNDLTLSGLGTTVDTNNQLLARLELDASGAVAGDTFTVEAIPGPIGMETTFFEDTGGMIVPVDSLLSGTVMIQSAAVPEPTSIALIGIAGIGLAVAYRRKRVQPSDSRMPS